MSTKSLKNPNVIPYPYPNKTERMPSIRTRYNFPNPCPKNITHLNGFSSSQLHSQELVFFQVRVKYLTDTQIIAKSMVSRWAVVTGALGYDALVLWANDQSVA